MADESVEARPPRTTIADFKNEVLHALGCAEAWLEISKQDGKTPHPDVVKRAQTLQDLLTLLGKLELCRPEIKKLFDAKRALFLSRGIIDQ